MIENRIHNFNPGPAVLPEPVLLKARANLLNFENSGLGVMELSHRGKHFEDIISRAELLLRELLNIPSSYRVLFCTGGASQQFSMVPMNLLSPEKTADFILTGVWAEAALEEAKKFGATHIAASSKAEHYTQIPEKLELSSHSAYLHFTSNNTVVGTQFANEPQSQGATLVCDASSDLLCRPLDITRYGLIYAGAQKNLGTAGVTIVIIQEELLARSPANLPLMMNYNLYAKNRSLYNTPPTFPIYILQLMLEWIKNLGGLSAMEKINREKARLLYDTLDSFPIYVPLVEKTSRSMMNVTFRLQDAQKEEVFLKKAELAGFIGLKGHRLMGGCRASLYNACPTASVEALVAFMRSFAASDS